MSAMNEKTTHTKGGDNMATTTKTTPTKAKAAAPAKEVAKTFRPKDLATELNIDAKKIRAWLRKVYKEDHELRTSWLLSEKQAQAVRDHFTASDDEDDEV